MIFKPPTPSVRRVDLAPMVDLTFLLLIFFIVGSQFAVPVLDLNLPQASSGHAPSDRALVVTIQSDGTFSSNRQIVKPEGLSDLLKSRPDASLTIRADQKVEFRYFVQLLDLARLAGLKEIQIEHQPN